MKIVDMLATYHDIKISLRSLKTHLKDNGMFRRKNYSPINNVRNAIRAELRGPDLQCALEGYQMNCIIYHTGQQIKNLHIAFYNSDLISLFKIHNYKNHCVNVYAKYIYTEM